MKKAARVKIEKPSPKWQTGAYKRHASFKFFLPYQFLLLCKLLQVTPEEVIRDFTINLDCGSWQRDGKDIAKQHLINYFIECGYGERYYTIDNIRQMFKEMDALGSLFPKDSNKMKLVKLHAKWRDKHQNWWFKKWYYKIRRKPLSDEER